MSNDWYIKINNVEHGPFSPERLKQLAQDGKVTPKTPVKRGTSGHWVSASAVKGLPFSTATHSAPSSTVPPAGAAESRRSTLTGASPPPIPERPASPTADLEVVCPSCGQSSPIKPDFFGKKVRCRCGNTFIIEAPEPDESPMIVEEEILEPLLADDAPEEENPIAFLDEVDLRQVQTGAYPDLGAAPRARIIEPLPATLAIALKQLLRPREPVHVKLQGQVKQALVCTDTRVIIVKAGFLTGNTFGSDVFQVPYGQIAGVQIKSQLLLHYFEVSTGGMQNRGQDSYGFDPLNEPNCVTLYAHQVAQFRKACSFIYAMIDRKNAAPSPQATSSESDIIGALERLAALRDKGVISEKEFLAKKADLLSRM